MLNRRSLLLSSIAAIAVDSASFSAIAGSAEVAPTYAAAARPDDGSFALVLLSADGALLRQIPLSARGHDIAVHPASGRAVAFARRPGTYAVAFNLKQAGEPVIFSATNNRHFFGHGTYSRDGRLLYVSENDTVGARGVIGIYDAVAGYRRIGEHRSFGVGPHEIILLQDGRTLAIANGGLDTTPDAGPENINLDAMQPSLAFVDAVTGDLKCLHVLASDCRQLSIRHIAADRAGRVWFGGQWEGALSNSPALIGSASMDRGISLVEDQAIDGVALKGYIGSVAAGVGGSILAASAPKAGLVIYVDCETGRLVAESQLRDACGLAPHADEAFAVTSGFGIHRREKPDGAIIAQAELAGVAFDNHLRRIA